MIAPRAPRGQGTYTTVGGGLGVIILLALWVLASHGQPGVIMPGPGETWEAFQRLAVDGSLVTELARTLWRALTGVILGVVIGSLWGVLNGLSRWAAAISQPAISTLMAIAPVIYVAIGLIWFGPGDAVARLVIILVTLPLTVVTVQEAVRNVDAELIEMAHVFGVTAPATFRHVVLPAITSPVLAAATVTFGGAVRVTVMAELLAATDGVGAEVSTARVNLATADLFAWTLVLVLVVIMLEALVLRPMTNRALRWRSAAHTPRTRTLAAADPGQPGADLLLGPSAPHHNAADKKP